MNCAVWLGSNDPVRHDEPGSNPRALAGFRLEPPGGHPPACSAALHRSALHCTALHCCAALLLARSQRRCPARSIGSASRAIAKAAPWCTMRRAAAAASRYTHRRLVGEHRAAGAGVQPIDDRHVLGCVRIRCDGDPVASACIVAGCERHGKHLCVRTIRDSVREAVRTVRDAVRTVRDSVRTVRDSVRTVRMW